VREETGQTNRRKQPEPVWTRTEQAFPNSAPHNFSSAPISETPVQCGKKRLGGESLFRIAPMVNLFFGQLHKLMASTAGASIIFHLNGFVFYFRSRNFTSI